MIIDYCKENKVAIAYNNQVELKVINQAFGRKGKYECLGPPHGVVSHYTYTVVIEGVTQKYTYRSSSLAYIFEDYTIITAEEFFELVGEKSIIEN